MIEINKISIVPSLMRARSFCGFTFNFQLSTLLKPYHRQKGFQKIMVSVIFRNGTGKASTQLYTAWKNTMMIIFKLWDGGSAHFFHGRQQWHHEHYAYIAIVFFQSIDGFHSMHCHHWFILWLKSEVCVTSITFVHLLRLLSFAFICNLHIWSSSLVCWRLWK